MTSLAAADLPGEGRPLTLVAVHGTGGSGRAERDGWARHWAASAARPARLRCPDFGTPYQFLLPHADADLLRALGGLADTPLHLIGFSGGGQFAHRFAQRHPGRVAACCALSAGAWTHPDGTLAGMMVEDGWFGRPGWDDPAVGAAGREPAAGDVRGVRWLIGCGRRDLASRYDSARGYHAALTAAGCRAGWVEWDGGHEGVPDDVAARVIAFIGDR